MKILKHILVVQSIYVFATAIWPIVNIESFMAATGPKTDVWLVKTVGAMLLPVAIALFVLSRHIDENQDALLAIVLGGGIALAFLVIDVYYTERHIIASIYLLDAVFEGIFLAAWIWIAFRIFRSQRRH